MIKKINLIKTFCYNFVLQGILNHPNSAQLYLYTYLLQFT